MQPYSIEWLDEAKTDVRRVDRQTAMGIFDVILHYATTGGGDVPGIPTFYSENAHQKNESQKKSSQ